jgi:isoleucyl-tRNA synthetase
VPLFAGKKILTPEGKDGDANGAVIKELIGRGMLLSKGTLRHQYPHSWRSKAPVIFRATPQWFAAIDKPFAGRGDSPCASRARRDRRPSGSRARARTASAPWSSDRPDWVLSRQRAWGVPIAVFVHKQTGELSARRRRERAHRRGLRERGRRRLVQFAAVALPRQREPANTSRSRTFSMSGSTPARRMPSWSRNRSTISGLRRTPISISKAPISIAAGSSLRCSNPAAPRARAL